MNIIIEKLRCKRLATAVLCAVLFSVVAVSGFGFYQGSGNRGSAVYREMIRDTVAVWEIFFADDRAPKHDRRREQFSRYALALVESVVTYQEKPTSIGGILPIHRTTHVVAAQIVTKESSLFSDVVGSRGEVGLMQLMPRGPAIAGYRPKRIRKDPELGIRLGVRWLAYSVGRCNPKKKIENWKDEDWLGPLSFYSGGARALRKNGTCKIFGIARKRLKKALEYRQRIDSRIIARGPKITQ